MVKDEAVSNLLGSPASGEDVEPDRVGTNTIRFQFIGFPSEWGVAYIGFESKEKADVSNLLGSPASGEVWGYRSLWCKVCVSNLLGSPASGEFQILWRYPNG